MDYKKFIERVLDGKSVNARAKELGIPQTTLNSYMKRSVPSCGMTMKLAEVAGIPLEEAVRAVAEQELKVREKHSPTFLKPAMASVLMAIAVIVNFFLTPTPAQAAPVLAKPVATLCIM